MPPLVHEWLHPCATRMSNFKRIVVNLTLRISLSHTYTHTRHLLSLSLSLSVSKTHQCLSPFSSLFLSHIHLLLHSSLEPQTSKSDFSLSHVHGNDVCVVFRSSKFFEPFGIAIVMRKNSLGYFFCDPCWGFTFGMGT